MAPTKTTLSPDYTGAVDPNHVNMKAVQAVISIICVGFIVGIIWFFFWAKNGGFHFRRGDWDEYKSTVLRRKGPNGTTLSNATKSTRLGGGSVVGQGYSDRDAATSYADDTSTIYTGTMTELSSSTAPIIKEKQGQYTGDKRSRKKSRRDETAKERKQRETKQAQFEGGNDDDLRAYIREKPARVGGINTTGDTLHYGTDYTETEPSIAYDAPHDTSTPSHRQPSSQWQQQPASYRAGEQQRRSARDAGNNSNTTNTRRDFSYTIGGQQEQRAFTVAPTERSESPPPTRVPAQPQATPNPQGPPPRYHNAPPNLRGGGFPAGASAYSASTHSTFSQPSDRELQQNHTKSYHHPIPGLAAAAAPQRGYRRGKEGLDE